MKLTTYFISDRVQVKNKQVWVCPNFYFAQCIYIIYIFNNWYVILKQERLIIVAVIWTVSERLFYDTISIVFKINCRQELTIYCTFKRKSIYL